MKKKRKNVLFIMADQWRGDTLGCINHPVVQTPYLDQLAGEGVLFRKHYAQAVPCGPSRASKAIFVKRAFKGVPLFTER